MRQNYFQFDQEYYEQTEGLTMGAPVSAILAEIFTQYMEHKYIPNFKNKRNNGIL
jgi:hypothetical protein